MIDIDQLQAHADDLIAEFCDNYCIYSIVTESADFPEEIRAEQMRKKCEKCPADALIRLIYTEED